MGGTGRKVPISQRMATPTPAPLTPSHDSNRRRLLAMRIRWTVDLARYGFPRVGLSIDIQLVQGSSVWYWCSVDGPVIGSGHRIALRHAVQQEPPRLGHVELIAVIRVHVERSVSLMVYDERSRQELENNRRRGCTVQDTAIRTWILRYAAECLHMQIAGNSH